MVKKKQAGAAATKASSASPESELRALISRLSPAQQKLVQSIRAKLRKRFPTANELAYDYPKQVVIAFSPNENGIDGIVSIAAHADGTDLHLNNGPQLPDPKRLLQGSGKMTRFLRVDSAAYLAHPDVSALIDAAGTRARVPMPASGKGGVVIKSGKSSGAKQRAGTNAKKKSPSKARNGARK